MSKKPTEKFSFGGDFSVGGGLSGESSNALQAGAPKQAWKPRGKAAPADEEEEEEEDDEDDEDEDDEGNDLADLPPEILRRVTKIRNIHLDYEEIEKAYKVERIALEKKFLEQKKLVIEKRRQIVTGEVEVPAEEGEDQTEEAGTVGIPGFWLTCLTSHPSISELITEEDVPALEHLTDITCAYDDNFTSFSLTFHFKENEFFTNTTLTKTYEVSPDLLDEKAPALSHTSCSEIEWKTGKDLTVTETVKKQKAKSGKNKGQVKTVVTTAPKPSFFHYFGMPMTEEEEAEAEENEDEDAPQVKLSMEEDYDVGHSIRTSLIPEAVLWYTGEAIEEEDDEDDEGLYDDAEDDDEDDEEESDDEDTPAPRMNKSNKKGKGSGKADSKLTFTPEGGFASTSTAAPGDKAECKQN
mmetsp:Transcript_3836/g.9909  ORF Transcript_3836/g.9909 Transcript_3836/m.9909 type:complete len:410 (-) Transcript_3836:186-1415(-)